jgi:two-component system nitrogen regulation response regulator NtrX
MNQAAAYILVVDDEPDIRQLVSEILADEGYTVAMADNAQTARSLKAQREPDLILLDIWMPDTDGITLLKQWAQEDQPLCPVVMMSGHGSVETAVEATRLGAYDFLEKPLSLAKLLLVVARALETRHLQRENAGLKQQLMLDIEPVGKSASSARIKEQLKRLAQHDTRVSLVGEAGVGKALYARYLHSHSAQREGAFVEVALGCMSPENAAVEFFGKENQEPIYQGLLEQAHGGSLFLAEIAELDKATQLRLLNALESGCFYRVGGNSPVHVDVRLISSSREPLDQAVSLGQFRSDLYYLLNEVSLEIPSLRDHNEDVPVLLAFYVDYFVRQEKLPFRKFAMAAQNFLRLYGWPGNVRELKNLVQRLMILGVGDDIELDEVKTALGSIAQAPQLLTAIPEFFNLPLKEAREHFEKNYLEYHFEKNSGSVAKLAAAIGMERTHLYRKLHALKIKR